MGSASDISVVEKGTPVLDELGIEYEVAIASAHRTPEDVEGYAKKARARGIQALIAVAGLSAALPGVVAAATTLPVIGVPVKGGAIDGMDALLSIAQMPPGVPAASVGLNGAKKRLPHGGAHSSCNRLRAHQKTRSLRREGIPESPRQPQKTGKPPRRARRSVLKLSKVPRHTRGRTQTVYGLF